MRQLNLSETGVDNVILTATLITVYYLLNGQVSYIVFIIVIIVYAYTLNIIECKLPLT